MIKVNSTNLQEGLKYVGQTCPVSPYQDILKSVLVHVENDVMNLTTTDLTGTTQVSISCVSDTEISFLIEYRTLQNYISTAVKAGIEVIEIIKVDNKITLIAKGIPKMSFPTRDVDEYPLLLTVDDVDEDNSFEMETQEFLKILSCYEFTSVSTTPLTGIFVGKTHCEATDGFTGKRLFVNESVLKKEFILPASIQKSRGLFSKSETVRLKLDKTSLYIFGNSWTLKYQLILGNYPDTSKGYVNSAMNIIYLDKNELVSTLDTLKLAGDNATISVDYDTITFSTFSVIGATSGEQIISVPSGEIPNEIVVDISFFTKVLKNITDGLVKLSFGKVNEVILIENETEQYFVVPLGKG